MSYEIETHNIDYQCGRSHAIFYILMYSLLFNIDQYKAKYIFRQ